jgi:hypothetical protein
MKEPITQEQAEMIANAFKKVVEALEVFIELIQTITKRFLKFVRALWKATYPERAHKMRKTIRYRRIYERRRDRQTA